MSDVAETRRDAGGIFLLARPPTHSPPGIKTWRGAPFLPCALLPFCACVFVGSLLYGENINLKWLPFGAQSSP